MQMCETFTVTNKVLLNCYILDVIFVDYGNSLGVKQTYTWHMKPMNF